MIFENDCFSLCLSLTFFVELMKIFGVLQNLVQKLTVSILLACLLAAPHVLLEPVDGPCFLFVMGVGFSSSVELAVNQLSLIHNVTQCLYAIVIKSHLAIHVIAEDVLSHLLLEIIEIETLQVHDGRLFLFFTGEVVLFDEILKLKG